MAQIENIFNVELVPPAELAPRKSNFGLDRYNAEIWWDVQTKTLIGGNFTVQAPGSQGTRVLQPRDH